MDITVDQTTHSEVLHSKQKIIIVDPREIVGLGLKQAICQGGTCIETDYVTDVEQLLQKLKTYPYSMVIFCDNIVGRCCYAAAEEIRGLYPEIKTAFIARSFSSLQIERGLRVRSKGFFLEQDSVEKLIHGIKRVLLGEYYFSTGLEIYVGHLDYQKITANTSQSEILALTNRQIEVLVYLAKSYSVKEAAKIMHISDKSVDSHKYRIMHRLNIHDRVELALFALKEGLIDL